MHDELDRRVVRALRAEADSFSVTLTVDEIEARLARGTAVPWLLPVAAVLGVAAMLLVVVGVGSGIGLPFGDSSAPPDEAIARDDAQLWPESALPAPYDWEGMAAALRPRGNVVERPSVSQVRQASGPLDRLLEGAEQHLADDPRAQVVGVHVAVVTAGEAARSRGLILEREPMYIVETTGHGTGNCFDLWSIPSAGETFDRPVVSACFYPNRSRPLPPVTELPIGTWVSRSAFRDSSICVALAIERPLSTSHRAWWWHPGRSGDCGSRSGSTIDTEATTDDVPLVKVELPTISRGSETLSLRFTGYTEEGFTLDTVLFHAVEEVDPVEMP